MKRARASLAQLVRETRTPKMTQADLVKCIKTSQPRIAKAEAGESNVSIHLLVRAALGAGARLDEIGKALVSAATSDGR